MRKLATLGLLLALGAAAVGVSIQLAHAPRPSSIAPAPIDESAATELADAAPAESSATLAEATSDERQAVSREAECRLFGVVVDDLAQPLADVTVRLDANDGTLKREARTDESGRYELRTLLPGKGLCELSFSTEQLLSAGPRRLWLRDPNGSLRLGDNDLGRTVMLRAAAIEGRVKSSDGTPVPHLEVGVVDHDSWGHESPHRWTAADGSYRLAPLAPGAYQVAVVDYEFAEAEVVHLSASETRSGVDIVLPTPSFIAGRVVDEAGSARPSASVLAFSAGDESTSVSARARADDAGWFCLPLPVAQPHRLSANWPDHKVDLEANPGVVFAAGETNARLVLASLRVASFKVVDALTHQPLARFGLRLVNGITIDGRVEGSASTSLQIAAHPGGLAEFELGPGERVFQVASPGYAAREDAISAEASSEGGQVIEMSRGGAISGRVTLDGKSIGLGSARVTRAAIGRTESRGTGSSRTDATERYDLSAFLGRQVIDSLDGQGAFRFEDLAPGTYELTVRAKSASRATLSAVQVGAGQRVDVGEVALVAGATVSGRALLPPRAVPTDARVLASCERRTRTDRLDAQAHFEIEDLPAGRCTLSVPAVEGVLVDGPPTMLDLAPGQTHEIALDLRDREGMWLDVRVRAAGVPLADVDVDSLAAAAIGSRDTDESGRARLWQRRAERVSIELKSSYRFPLGRFERDVRSGSDRVAHLDLDLEVATLIVDWRNVSGGAASQVGVRVGPKVSTQVTGVGWIEPRTRGDSESGTKAETRWNFGPIAVGNSEVQLVLLDRDLNWKIECRRSITCRAGEVIECVFTDADRVEQSDATSPRGLGHK